jgi:hypothetical protein
MASMAGGPPKNGRGGVLLGFLVGLILGAVLLAPRAKAPLQAQIAEMGEPAAAAAWVTSAAARNRVHPACADQGGNGLLAAHVVLLAC